MLIELKQTLEKKLEQTEKSNEQVNKLISKLNKIKLDKEELTIEKTFNLESANNKILEKIDEINFLETQLLELLENKNSNSYSQISQKSDSIENYLENILENIANLQKEFKEIADIQNTTFQSLKKAIDFIKNINEERNIFNDSALKITIIILKKQEKKLPIELESGLNGICYIIDNNIYNIPDTIYDALIDISLHYLEVFPKTISEIKTFLETNEVGVEVREFITNVRVKSYFIYKNITEFQEIRDLNSEWKEVNNLPNIELANKSLLEKISEI
ncbi:MAG: hypothetical protein QNJ55_18565 [Xenococcus sp. MO_188.B8]|nr:hypothetical protein [Xenococcus sp. MO_188.B8]